MAWRERMLGALGVLGEPNFRRFVTGYAASFLGSEMAPVAVTFAVLGNGGNATDVGYVLMGEAVPLVVFLLVGGVMADKLGRRTVMIGADLLRLSSQGLLAALLLTGTPVLWELVVLEAMVGTGQAFFGPAMTGLIPEVASPGRLQQANAMNGLASSAGGVVGPALAGLIVATTNPGWAIAADAATYLVSATCLVRLRLPPVKLAPPSPFLADLRSGWREFRSRTWLWVVVVDFAFFHLLVFAPMIVLGAVVADTSLGGAAAWGVILAAFGAGAVVGGLAMLRLRPARPLLWGMVGTIWLAAPIALLAAAAPTAAISAAAFVAGIGFAAFGTLWDTTMQRQVPADILSRVSSYDWFGS
ncbi:MAG: MFS transporter, partial [Acidimicrobiales bacterium]